VDVSIVRRDMGNDSCNFIIGSISLNNNGIIRVEMHKDGCCGKGMFEGPEHHDMVETPYEGVSL